jgi:jumonji domain-containing protein 2
MEELASFDTYVAYMESQGAHKAGIARIVPPKDWTARKAGYEPFEVDIIIDNPVKPNYCQHQGARSFHYHL